MGFGGGSSGLSSPPLRAMRLIESYVATIAEASKVFTIPAAFQSPSDVSAWILYITGSNITVTSMISLQINGLVTALYDEVGSRQLKSTGVITNVSLGNRIDWSLFTQNTPIAECPYSGYVIITLPVNSGATRDQNPQAVSEFIVPTTGTEFNRESMWHSKQDNVTTLITEIRLLATASNWNIGTRASLYAIMKVEN